MQQWIKDKVLPGLYIRESITKSVWAVKARQRGFNGVVTVTLGRCDVISANEARRQAKEALALLAQGINPNQQRDEQVQAQLTAKANAAARGLTLGDAITSYLGLKQLKPNTVSDLQKCLTRNFPDWLDRPLTSITREDVQQRFQDIKQRVQQRRKAVNESKAERGLQQSRFTNSDGAGEAQRAFRYLTAVINSFKNDVVGGAKLLDSNPCDVLSDKKVRRQLPPRETYLTERQIKDLFDQLTYVEHPEYKGQIKADDADFVLLLLATGMRVDEVKQLRWSDINFLDGILRAVDTKNHRTHSIPLTKSTTALLKRRKKKVGTSSSWVFPSEIDPANHASMSRALQRVSAETGIAFTPHDLRRTFATTAAEMGFDLTKIGAALNHKKKGVTAGYVQTTVNMLRETFEAIESVVFQTYDINDEEQARR